MTKRAILSLMATMAAGACTGTVGDGPGGDEGPRAAGGDQSGPGGASPTGGPAGTTSSKAPPPATVPARCQNAPIQPGPSYIRRLTRTEYNNTVRDLLGDTTRPASAFAPEDKDRLLGFDNGAANLVVSPLLAEQYLNAAEQIAARAVTRLDKLLSCDPTTASDACVRTFVTTFGKRAWRRPLASTEADDAMGLYAWGKGRGGVAVGARLVLTYFLMAPEFFYRIEVGAGAPVAPGVVKVAPFELASRLSYQLWNTMPDDALLAAAESGQLASKDQVAAQARRMLDDPRARDAATNFHGQWLQLDKLDVLEKDAKVFPTYSADLRPLFRAETQTFIDQTIWSGDGKLATLLTAPYTFMNARLAQFYGTKGPAGTALEKVPTDPARRLGLLTQASFLATQAKPNQTSPVYRGKFVREQLFCTPPPPPPPDVEIVPPDLDPKLTTRERFYQHEANPACGGCHSLIDRIGLGLENYDGIGQWRATESGKPIDATGEVVGTDVAGPFNGAAELARKLGASADVGRCVATQWFRFSYGRNEASDDECTLAQLGGAMGGGGSVKDLLLALTQTDAFMYRKAVVPGGPQ